MVLPNGRLFHERWQRRSSDSIHATDEAGGVAPRSTRLPKLVRQVSRYGLRKASRMPT
jgi:hypothetical protein